MRYRTVPLAVFLMITGCGVDPTDPAGDQPRLNCGGPCQEPFIDLDGDGDGVPANDDCDDGNSARYQYLSCYADADKDHFGAGAATTVCAGLTCADGIAGYAHSAGDCDDQVESIHPHRGEEAGNDTDDNCADGTDEARTRYFVGGNGNTDSSFTIKVKLNSTADLAQATAKTGLDAKIYYRKLANASSPYSVTANLPMSVTTAGGATFGSVTLTGLSSLTVYEARLDFYEGGRPSQRITPASGCAGTAATGCSNSNVYYTITKPAGEDMVVRTARYEMVLNALFEFYHFRLNNLGDWDDSLRDRFELAQRDSAYCSEFYATVAKPFLLDMNPCDYVDAIATPQCDPNETSPEEDYVGEVRGWFDAYGSASNYHGRADMAVLKPGDYLGVNPNSTDTNGIHSQMFLAWDEAADDYWFVEGNGGYDTIDGDIKHSVNVGSHDHCTDEGGSWSPDEADDECESDNFYIKTIGRMNEADMLD